MISELRILFQKAVKQAQEQIEAIDDVEGRIQQQLNTFEVRVNETLAVATCNSNHSGLQSSQN